MNCLSVFYHSLGLALKGIIVRLVLPLKIIISGKINASAATARATCLFLYTKIRLVTDIVPGDASDL